MDHPARASTGQFHGFEVVQSKEFSAAHSVNLPAGEYMCVPVNSLPFVGVNAQIKYTHQHNRAWTSLQRALPVHGNKIKHLIHVTFISPLLASVITDSYDQTVSFTGQLKQFHQLFILHYFSYCVMKQTALNTSWRGYMSVDSYIRGAAH